MASITEQAQHFPEIADELSAFETRVRRDYENDKMPGDPSFSTKASIERELTYLWEFFTILDQVMLGIRDTKSHDELAAQLGEIVGIGAKQAAAIRAATDQARAAMGDVAIDHHLTQKED